VQDLANRVHQLASAAGRPELARELEDEATRYKTPATTVVVVGEQKRGKSSLINALLDAPALLPVDVDVASSVHVAVMGGDPGATVERETVSGDVEPIEVPVSAITEWASEQGNPRNEKAVRSVTVRAPHPLLERGLVLVDTPGVGGLDSTHTEVTLATLATADALLFVVDASSPITASELDFLERATHRIDTVVVALTKTDAFRGWQTILDDDKALIAAHAPRFANVPIAAVSSRMKDTARRAASEGRVEFASRALGDSGFDVLVAHLERLVLARAAGVRLANLVRLTSRVAGQLMELDDARVAGAVGDPELRTRLEAEQERLHAVAQHSAKWRVELDAELRQLGLDFDAELEWAFQALDRDFEERIAKSHPDDLEHFDTDLNNTLEALWLNINVYLRDRFAGIIGGLVDTLALDGLSFIFEDLEMPERVGELIDARASSASPGDENAASKFLNYYPVVFAGSGVSMLASNLRNLGLFAIGGGPLVLLSGAAMAGMFTVRRSISRRTRSVRDSTRLLKTALPHARSTIAKQFARSMIDVRRAIEDDIGGRLEARRRDIERVVREQQELLREDATRQQRVKAEAEQRLAQLARLRATAGALQRELSTATSA
jgi:signal recognition particle receptor subunit beta